MEQKRPIPTERLRTIRGQMVERFSLEELRDLTFDLGVNWDQLPGNNLGAKTTELLEQLNRRTQLPALLTALARLRPGDEWALDDLDESAVSPYKGLPPYNAEDASLFFGRERLTAALLTALHGRSILAVVGASGSGKSSVVRAGVVPALRGDRPPPDGAELPRESRKWAYLDMTPTERPLEELALTLTQDLDTVGEMQAIIRDLAEGPVAAHLYVRKYLERQKKPHCFLLVDQFEELFTTCKDETERAAFIDGVLAAAQGGKTTVVLTLRADFYHHCLRYDGLRDVLQHHQLPIGAMSEAELREAVEMPAARTGYELEPGLTDLIVRDTGREDGSLPLLSHALLETWRRREGRRLTHFGYQQAGGVGGAIARTAERAYGDLDPQQQAVARRIFLQLTELGEGAEDTRRRVPLDKLRPEDPARREATEAVLDALARARLVTADDEAAQVTHEALIREWPALGEWLRDEREGLRLERRLEEAATVWEAGGREADYLYGGAQLAAALAWAADHPDSLTGLTRAFLDAAAAEEEQEAAEREAARRQRERLTRRAFVGVSTFAALAVLAAMFAFSNWRQAVDAKEQAEISLKNEEEARQQAVAAYEDASAQLLLGQGERAFESDPLLADRLVLEAMLVAKSNAVQREVADALKNNLSSGRTDGLFPDGIASFTPVLTNTVVFHYLSGIDLLISDAGGLPPTILNENVDWVQAFPDSPYFVVDYEGDPGELRRRSDGEQVAMLDGIVSLVVPIPDSPYFAVGYEDDQGELRRRSDGEEVATLDGDDFVSLVVPIPDSSYFVVGYKGATGELRQANAFDQFMTLNGIVSHVIPIPNSPFFGITYDDAPGELFWMNNAAQAVELEVSQWTGEVAQFVSLTRVVNHTDPNPDVSLVDWGGSRTQRAPYTGTKVPEEPFQQEPTSPQQEPTSPQQEPTSPIVVVTDKAGRRVAQWAEVLGETGYFLFHYQDESGEIISDEHILVDLGIGIEQSFYFPEANRVAVRYGGGRVNYIDLDLIEAIGGTDAEATLAAMSPEELIVFTCETLFTDNPDWDEAKLEEYVAFLPEGRARACGE